MNTLSDYIETYLDFLKGLSTNLKKEDFIHIENLMVQTQWEDPQSGFDWNNVGVMALLEAEATDDLTMRSLYLETAIEAFQEGAETFPLSAVNLALVQSLIGNAQAAIDISSQILLGMMAQPNSSEKPGMIYIPKAWNRWPDNKSCGEFCILEENGYKQVIELAAEVLWRSPLVFYNSTGLRALEIAAQVLPNSVAVQFRLGIAMLMNQRTEGLLALRHAWDLAPNVSEISQALYLSSRSQQQIDLAEQWKTTGIPAEEIKVLDLSQNWIKIPNSESYTTVVFDEDILMAVEPSLQSIVTSVLLAEGDWFEQEMEWWRSFIKPGMTVIDVGANVGVYTFSAAKKVGQSGRVIAVEPFSACVECLKQTCLLNDINWVSVIEGAASNTNGIAHLGLHSASELNELVNEEDLISLKHRNTEKVKCFTLDTIYQHEKLSSVDLIKIDAEGHELSVLEGARGLLSQHKPILLYENLTGNRNNWEVTNRLRKDGYDIFKYQPFTQSLTPIDSVEDTSKVLNLIAYPSSH